MCEVDEHITKKFKIRSRLGKGAYGIVWKAIDRKTKDVVAVKKIFDAFRNQTDAQRTFREIMYLREFGDHPNIIKLHSIHRASNNKDIYLVFEFMDTDLNNIIKGGNILKDIHQRFIMYQLFKATKYIHSGNVIHRDQKPSNILLDAQCHCKIADFGLARSVKMLAVGSGDTCDPALTDYVATRWYRAPEILIASKRYTKGIDMWSLGCILAEMLLGKPLFPGSSTINQLERIMLTIPSPSAQDLERVCPGYGNSLLQHPPAGFTRPLHEILHEAPPDALDLISKLLVFNPHQRLTAAQALMHPYVVRFHDTANEPKLEEDVVTPLRDDVQLTVDEYRNKLYDLMGSGVMRISRHLLCKPAKEPRNSIQTVPTSHLPPDYVTSRVKSSQSSWWRDPQYHPEKRIRHVSVETVRPRLEQTQSRTSASITSEQPGRYTCSQRRFSHGQACPHLAHSAHETTTVRLEEGNDKRPRPQAQEGPKLVRRHHKPHNLATSSVCKTEHEPRVTNSRNQHVRLKPLPEKHGMFNSYNQSHGVITASALREICPKFRI